MRIDHLLLCFLLPLVLVSIPHIYSLKHLLSIPIIASQHKNLRVFAYSRLLYWYIFGILICAFLLGMILFSSGGNLTRTLIAFRTYGIDNVPTFVIEKMSIVFLPLIFLTLFVSMIYLGLVGKSVLKQMPAEGAIDERFTRFRFTFFVMALSLIIPPLAFGSLLLL